MRGRWTGDRAAPPCDRAAAMRAHGSCVQPQQRSDRQWMGGARRRRLLRSLRDGESARHGDRIAGHPDGSRPRIVRDQRGCRRDEVEGPQGCDRSWAEGVVQGLRVAGDQFLVVPVHPAVGQGRTVSHPRAVTRAFELSDQRQILEHLVLHRGMATGAEVCVAAHRQQLPVPCGQHRMGGVFGQAQGKETQPGPLK